MKRFLGPAVPIIALSLLGCAADGEAVCGDERSEIERSVRTAVDALADAQRRRDVNAILEIEESDVRPEILAQSHEERGAAAGKDLWPPISSRDG